MSGLAFGLYLAFVCSWFLHLTARIPGLGMLRADLVLVCIIIVLSLMGLAATDAPAGERRTRKVLWALVIYAAVTIPLVEWPGSVVRMGFPQFFKAFVFFWFTSALVTTQKRVRWLLIVFLACQTFRVAEPLYLHLTEGYWGSSASMADDENMDRLSGAPSDVVNPNGLAFIVLTVIPFLHYLMWDRVAGRLVYLAALPLLLYVLVLTGSRSGMVGLAGVFGLIWLKSRHKLAMLAVMAVAVVLALPRLSPDLQDRYLSLFSSNTRNAGSAEGRLEGMKADLQVTMHRPVFGHGLGTSREANTNFGNTYQPSHSLYLEISQELGVCGLLIFLLFVHSLVFGLADTGRLLGGATAPSPLLSNLVSALQVFLGMNLLFSFASYGLSGYEWYLTAGLTDVIGRLAQQPVAAVGAVASADRLGATGGSLPQLPRVCET